MKLLRTLPTRRLLLLLAAIVAVAIGGSALAIAASTRTGDAPPPASLADALHAALNAPKPEGVTARVTFTNNLFPSGALLGQATSPLISGATGRLWITGDGRGRLELQSDAGDAQIVWNGDKVSVYDASTNTAYVATLPAQTSSGATNDTPPTLADITSFLNKLAEHWNLSGAVPTVVAGQGAYSVTVTPKTDAGLVGAGEAAWDASQGVPLRAGVYARGHSAPALQLEANDISYGPVPDSAVDIAPPAGAKVVDLGSPAGGSSTSEPKPVTGIDAVRAAAGFDVVAPDSLSGLPRTHATLVGGDQVVLVYGDGLGALVVTEHKADAQQSGGVLGALPAVPLDGAQGHELATQLGTGITWERGGVAFLLAGSVDAGQAEAAARALR